VAKTSALVAWFAVLLEWSRAEVKGAGGAIRRKLTVSRRSVFVFTESCLEKLSYRIPHATERTTNRLAKAASTLPYARLQNTYAVVRNERPVVDVRWLEHRLLRGSKLADPLRLCGLEGPPGEVQILGHVAVHQASALCVGVCPWELQGRNTHTLVSRAYMRWSEAIYMSRAPFRGSSLR
jgi:hypothetical protein